MHTKILGTLFLFVLCDFKTLMNSLEPSTIKFHLQ